MFKSWLEVRQKYSATRSIFNSLLGVLKCGQARSFLLDSIPSRSRIQLAEKFYLALSHWKQVLTGPSVQCRYETPTPATRIYFKQTLQVRASEKMVLTSCQSMNCTQNQCVLCSGNLVFFSFKRPL